jgi:hypothetical protein
MKIEKIIGYILITPALISVILFVIQFITGDNLLKNMAIGSSWTGNNSGDTFGYTSALPFYFGLMAIAGAYLIKDKK